MSHALVSKRRLLAAALHLACCTVVALLVLVVVRIWYPPPLSELAGGTTLFLFVVVIDIIIGPLLTAVVTSDKKPRGELTRDLATIVALQLIALAYGLHTISLARPVAVAFEVDLIRVVAAADVDPVLLADAALPFRELPLDGPIYVVTAKPAHPAEQIKTIELGLAGIPLSFLPQYWRDYASESATVWNSARPLAQLVHRYPETRESAKALASDSGAHLEDLRFLPVVARNESWVAVLTEPNAEILGYLPVDGFF